MGKVVLPICEGKGYFSGLQLPRIETIITEHMWYKLASKLSCGNQGPIRAED